MPLLFVTPIAGTAYVDWNIVNYVDLDPTAGFQDYRGGPFVYDGHDAIDYTLPNFAAMDAGVAVYAAAAGTVTFTHEGFNSENSHYTIFARSRITDSKVATGRESFLLLHLLRLQRISIY